MSDAPTGLGHLFDSPGDIPRLDEYETRLLREAYAYLSKATGATPGDEDLLARAFNRLHILSQRLEVSL